MAYTKTTWQDRVVQNPNTYTFQSNAGGTTTLLPAEGTVTTTGTPLTATNLNNLETQYDQALSWVQSFGLGTDQAVLVTDANAITMNGFYKGNNVANAPSTDYYSVIHNQFDGGTASQIAIGNTTGIAWFRQKGGGSWFAWKQLSTYNDFTFSKGNNGYQKLPNGLILQWGETQGASPISVNPLPITPPTTIMKAFVSPYSGAASTTATITSKTSQGFSIAHNAASTTLMMWFALTY